MRNARRNGRTMRHSWLAAAVAGALLSGPAPARADHPDRSGWHVGGGVGLGSGQTEVSDGEVTLGDGRITGLSANLRAGLFLGDRLAVGAELTAWGRKEDQTFAGVALPGSPGVDPSLTTEVNQTLAIGAVTATLFPLGGSLYVRGGLGYGTSRLDFDGTGFDTAFEEKGIAVLGAVGYEWRVASRIGLALEGEAGLLQVDDTGDGKDLGDFRELSGADFSANFFNGIVALNLYP